MAAKLLMAAAAVLAASAATGAASAQTAETGGKGTFSADCGFSHRAQVDPIVNPGTASAHMHDFFGAMSLDAFSTNDSIRQGGTTCVRSEDLRAATRRSADRSGYWVPTLRVDGQDVAATTLGAYYNTGFRDYTQIRPFPEGLRVIAGKASGGPQEINGQRVYFWEQRPDRLELNVRFPDCWDGVNLDSPDHQAHMAYSRQERPGSPRRVCPASHPVLVPQLDLKLRYPVTPGTAWTLSIGGPGSAHADFMNGWLPGVQEQLVADCLNTNSYCGGSNAPVPGK